MNVLVDRFTVVTNYAANLNVFLHSQRKKSMFEQHTSKRRAKHNRVPEFLR